ncbi:MAG: SecY-interacting protein [Glaciecola sp.]
MQSEWQNLMARYAKTVKLTTQFDQQWPSLCINEATDSLFDGQEISWQPIARPANDMEEFSQALGLTLPELLIEFYSAFFAEHLELTIHQGRITLLQAWNEEDFARLQENLIGHALMKRRLKQSPTLFIGLPENDDYLISVLINTGEVVLEPVGKEPTTILAPSLAHFFQSLCQS